MKYDDFIQNEVPERPGRCIEGENGDYIKGEKETKTAQVLWFQTGGSENVYGSNIYHKRFLFWTDIGQ